MRCKDDPSDEPGDREYEARPPCPRDDQQRSCRRGIALLNVDTVRRQRTETIKEAQNHERAAGQDEERAAQQRVERPIRRTAAAAVVVSVDRRSRSVS
jgi:hypothetical protein